MGQTLSRRDDIISTLYILIFLLNGKVNKYDTKGTFRQQFDSMKKYKEESTAKKYCDGNSRFLTPVLEYAYSI
jgi:hypothetical protein